MNFIKKILRKRLSQQEQIRLKFRDAFTDCVKSKFVRSALCGDAMMDGLLVYSAIANTYKILKDNKDMQMLRTLCILKDGYDPEIILKEELTIAMKKYCGMDIDDSDIENLQ